ncbi:MAG: hypothetical protein AB8G99_01370 [Planctomycetaceae bacterium]
MSRFPSEIVMQDGNAVGVPIPHETTTGDTGKQIASYCVAGAGHSDTSPGYVDQRFAFHRASTH